LRLEEVKEFFEEHGEFVFRVNQFYLDSLPDGYDISPSHVRMFFQRSFLGFLKNPTTKKQMEEQELLYSQQIADRSKRNLDPCQIAEEYFSDLLHNGANGSIPGDIKKHILDCPKCSRKFFQFGIVFSVPLSQERIFYIKNMTALLVRHFSLLDEKVYCCQVREFLPMLVDPRLEIRIPTPVTVHIENCSRCRKDLGLLLRLKLRPKQLARLAEFYSQPMFERMLECSDVRESIDLIAKLRFDEVPIRNIEHICLCKSCRRLLNNARIEITKQIPESERPTGYPCKVVSPSDLFDYCLPFGIDTADLESEIFHGPFISHIVECPICIQKMQKISDLLYSIAQREDSGIATCYRFNESPQNVELFPASDIFDELDADLYAGRTAVVEVDCLKAKQFLPLLAEAEKKATVAVPDSITAHIKLCPQCRADLQTIRSWNLDYKKRVRLAEFLSKQTFEQSDECLAIRQNSELITELVSQMRFEKLSSETLKHICLCRTCRNLLYDARTAMWAKVSGLPEKVHFPCESVGLNDLFDYVFPYGIDPARDEYARFRESLTGHLRQCPRCLEKMRQLHNSIYSIAHRGRFEVPAGYEFAKSPAPELWPLAQTRKKIAGRIEDIDEEKLDAHLAGLFENKTKDESYSRLGINVEVSVEPEFVPEAATPAKVIAFPQELRRRFSAMNLRRLRIPAAAIILLAVGLFLFLGTPAAKAINIAEVYNAITKVRNICISSLTPDKTAPAQKIWVSRALNIKLFKTGEQFVLWDIPNKIMKKKLLSSDSITATPLPENIFAKFEEDIEGAFGILPFSCITEVPQYAQWEGVTDEKVGEIVPGSEVYDLTWTKVISPTDTEYHKWRVFVDVQTHLPKREERYKKTAIKDKYILESIKIVTYPADSEIKAIIGDMGF